LLIILLYQPYTLPPSDLPSAIADTSTLPTTELHLNTHRVLIPFSPHTSHPVPLKPSFLPPLAPSF
jgi:hypothetical protein